MTPVLEMTRQGQNLTRSAEAETRRERRDPGPPEDGRWTTIRNRLARTDDHDGGAPSLFRDSYLMLECYTAGAQCGLAMPAVSAKSLNLTERGALGQGSPGVAAH